MNVMKSYYSSNNASSGNNGNNTNNDLFARKTNKQYTCANCGVCGHMYKSCNHPITSYGIICYRLRYDTNAVYPEYLMVQRKDSLSYVELLRGKYNIENTDYIIKLFSNMTENERYNIMNNKFEILWKMLWQINNTQYFQREYTEAKTKFNRLVDGYILKKYGSDEECFYNLKYIIENSKSLLTENEWGFPKGRRNINEKDLKCATREFTEETGIDSSSIDVKVSQKPFEEIFTGSNNVRYRHVYYIASGNKDMVIKNTKIKALEVRDVQWFKYNEAQAKISHRNIERKELLKRINQIVINNLLNYR